MYLDVLYNTFLIVRCKAYDNYVSQLGDENGHLKKSCKKFDEDYNEAVNKGNNKITELRTILQRESQNS